MEEEGKSSSSVMQRRGGFKDAVDGVGEEYVIASWEDEVIDDVFAICGVHLASSSRRAIS